MRPYLLVLLVLIGAAVGRQQAEAAVAALRVTVTAYTASAGETDSDPSMSACGRTFQGQLAVSRDLLRRYPCGSRVRLTVGGVTRSYTVNDTMNARWRMKVDVLMTTRTAAINFGRQTGTVTQ